MLINAYDTTVGKFLRSEHKVDDVIKTLHLSNNLTPTKKENVFVITNAMEMPFSALAFPVTLQTHTRKTVTVYDERPYRDKQNRPTNPNDITIMKLAAFLQQDVAEQRFTALKAARFMTTKAFAESLTNLITRRVGLDITEATTLKVLLSFYVVCLVEQPNTDLQFVGENVVRTVFGMEKDFTQGVIEGVPHLATLEQLAIEIRKNPQLYKLRGLGLKDLIALVSSLTFTGLGNKVVGAAAEAPCLMTAFVYGASTFKQYAKTPFGQTLEAKYNKGTLETFQNNIDYTYDLKG